MFTYILGTHLIPPTPMYAQGIKVYLYVITMCDRVALIVHVIKNSFYLLSVMNILLLGILLLFAFCCL